MVTAKFLKLKFLLLFLLCGNIFTGYASSPHKRKIYSFFINGIQNTREQARNSSDKLWTQANVHSNMISQDKKLYLLYNKIPETICPICTQIADAFLQNMSLKVDMVMDNFMDIYIKFKHLDPNMYRKGTPKYAELEKLLLPKIKSEQGVNQYFGSNLDDIESQYNVAMNDLKKNFKEFLDAQDDEPYILLVGHSQGSLYAEQLYQYITTGDKAISPKRIATFSIGTPSSTTDHHLDDELKKIFINDIPLTYITSANDHIIASASKLLYSNTPNITGSVVDAWKPSTTFGHGLVEYYLDDPDIQSKIQKYIDQFFIYLQMTIYNDSITKDNAFVYYSPTNSSLVDNNGHYICNHGVCEKDAAITSNYYLHTPFLDKRKSDAFYLIPVNVLGVYLILADKKTPINDTIPSQDEYTLNDAMDNATDNPGICNGKNVYPIYTWDANIEPPQAIQLFTEGCRFYFSKFNSLKFTSKYPQLIYDDMFKSAWLKVK